MLKQQAILATFETLSLKERRKLLSMLAEKSDLIINERECEESPFKYDVTYQDIDETFVKFLFSAYSRVFFFKEDIYKCYRLFHNIKEKCNFVLWRRNHDIKDTFCLAYQQNSTWKVQIAEEKDPSYPVRRRFLENKEEFFTHMLEYLIMVVTFV